MNNNFYFIFHLLYFLKFLNILKVFLKFKQNLNIKNENVKYFQMSLLSCIQS